MKQSKIVTLLFLAFVICCQIMKADSYTYTILQVPGGGATQAYGINDQGQVVGTYSGSTGLGYFLYSGGSYTYFDAPVGFAPTGINNAGQIVGNVYNYSAKLYGVGFLGNNGVFSPVNLTLGATAYGINNAGQIVGSYPYPNGNYGYILNPDGTSTNLNIGSDFTAAFGINDKGQVVGGYLNSRDAPYYFTYDNGAFGTLYRPSGTPGAPLPAPPMAINNAGQIVIGNWVINTGGYLTGMNVGGDISVLAVPAASTTTAYGINNLGQVAGTANRYGPTPYGFIATPTTVPEPRSFLLIAAGLAIIPLVRISRFFLR